jgi:20S proteasome subunit alpha 4
LFFFFTLFVFGQLTDVLDALLKHSDEGAERLAVRALMETVEAGGKNIEVAVLKKGVDGMRILSDEEVDAHVAKIEEDKARQAEQGRRPSQAQ